MSESRKSGAHAIIVTDDNKIVLQQKDLKYNINPVNRGKVSMYGGGVEKKESPLVALSREIKEELGIDISSCHKEKLGTYHKKLEDDGVEHAVHIFVVKGVNSGNLDPDFSDDEEAASLLIVDTLENLLKRSDLTRITKVALEEYFNQIRKLF